MKTENQSFLIPQGLYRNNLIEALADYKSKGARTRFLNREHQDLVYVYDHITEQLQSNKVAWHLGETFNSVHVYQIGKFEEIVLELLENNQQ